MTMLPLRPKPADDEEPVWELYHENSKTGRFSVYPSNEEVRIKMLRMWESLPYDGYPSTPLPDDMTALTAPIGEVILKRESLRTMAPCHLDLRQLHSLLHHAYGVTHDLTEQGYTRVFRASPSGGAMYPLELYVHSTRVEGLQAGLYHYNPTKRALALVRDGDLSRQIAGGLVQPELAMRNGLMIFITAMFERSTFKYGERGYRFALLEAGHVAQNLNLAATALGFGAVNIGGFFDRVIDQEVLGIDGINHGICYLVAVGGADADAWLETT